MAIKDKDFIEVEYTGTIKQDSIIFDTTDEKIAKENNIFDEKNQYKPIIVCIGQGQLLKGLDQQLVGKEIGKEYTIELSPEQAFGKKSAKLLKMVPANTFRKQKIQPVIGLQVNIDGLMGIIRTVTGGRVIVDFNHPLSSKDLIYKVKINKIITDDAKKIESFLLLETGFKPDKIEIKDSTANIVLKKQNLNIINNMKDNISDKLVELIDNIEKIEFTEMLEAKSSAHDQKSISDKQEKAPDKKQ